MSVPLARPGGEEVGNARQFRREATRRTGVVHDVMRSRPTSRITTRTSRSRMASIAVSAPTNNPHELEDDRANQAAIKIAGPTNDQYQQEIGRAIERKHFERGERRRLRQQCAGDAGIAGGDL